MLVLGNGLVEVRLEEVRERVLVGVQRLSFSLDVQIPSEETDCVDLKLVDMVLAEIVVHEDDPKAEAKNHDNDGEFQIA